MLLSERTLVHVHHAGTEPVAELVEEDGRDESADDIHQVVRLDVDRGAAEEEIEGQCDVEIGMAVLPEQDHQDGACPDVR